MPDWLYITRARALDSNLTHEGRLFGVPAWFEGNDDEIACATPKFPVLHAWCMLVDSLMELASYVLPADVVLVSPITITGRIK